MKVADENEMTVWISRVHENGMETENESGRRKMKMKDEMWAFYSTGWLSPRLPSPQTPSYPHRGATGCGQRGLN
jgi:hypothetical protein